MARVNKTENRHRMQYKLQMTFKTFMHNFQLFILFLLLGVNTQIESVTILLPQYLTPTRSGGSGHVTTG